MNFIFLTVKKISNPTMSSKKQKSIANKDKHKIKVKRELFLKKNIPDADGMTVYGQVTELLGELNFRVFCFDGQTRLCHIRGSIQKKQKVERDSIVIVGLREYTENKADIIYVYHKDESDDLLRLKEIPNFSTSSDQVNYNDENDTGFDFACL